VKLDKALLALNDHAKLVANQAFDEKNEPAYHELRRIGFAIADLIGQVQRGDRLERVS